MRKRPQSQVAGTHSHTHADSALPGEAQAHGVRGSVVFGLTHEVFHVESLELDHAVESGDEASWPAALDFGGSGLFLA